MKTAVEYIEEQMLYKQLDYQGFSMLIKEAKEMEEQQLNKAWQDGAATAQADAAKEIKKNYVARGR